MEINGLLRLGRKKKTATPENASAIKTCEVCVAVDYPQQGEKITAPCYTFRVGATGDPERVEISIEQGPWQSCRHSAGYWWYDWSGYTNGRYQAVAKAWASDGRVVTCEPRDFQVIGGKRKTAKNA